MARFEINRVICNGCGFCIGSCSRHAIELKGDVYVISPTLCRNCGDCMQSCPVGAISIVGTGVTPSDKEMLERLQKENRMLHERLRVISLSTRAMLENIPLAVLIADNLGRISIINKAFIDFLDYETREGSLLTGSGIDRLFGEDVVSHFNEVIHTGEPFNDLYVCFDTICFHGSIVPLVKGEMAMIMLRNLHDNTALKEEITTRIESVIDQSMAMIQKIGYLLGEEASKSTKTLNSIIRYIDGIESPEESEKRGNN